MTPGFVRGMGEILALSDGRLHWPVLIAPAAHIAHEGFEVYPYLETYYSFEGPDRPGYPDVFRKLATDRAARDQYLPQGRPLRTTQILRQPQYGQALERIAREGPEEFYQGGVGREIADDLAAHGALVTAEDLIHYHVQTVPPVRAAFRELVVYSNPPPGHGVVLLTMLNLVENLDLDALEWNGPEYLETIAWATRTAFADCMPYLANPSFVTVPVEWLISKDRLKDVQRDRALEIGESSAGPADVHTTHLSCADAEGDVVSITHSIGSIAGAGVMTRSLGFLYNNFIGHFNPLRGYHNSIASRKRLR